MTTSRTFLLFAVCTSLALSCSKRESFASAEATMAPQAEYAVGAAPVTQATPEGSKDSAKEQPKTWKRSNIVAHTSRLMIGDTEQLPIKGMQIHARVDGFRARVLVDFYFFNDTDRQYEGTFKMRLPTGASPYFLAFGQSTFEDVRYAKETVVRGQSFSANQALTDRHASWIEPKVARMVPRKKAGRAYNEVVRRRVDPALMEWAGAGVFNARIFPIAPRKLHRVVVGYDMNLTRVGDDLELRLPVPGNLPSSMIDLDIATPPGTRVTVSPEQQGSVKNARRYVRFDKLRTDTVAVRLHAFGAVALRGKDDAGGYFATRVAPPLPASRAVGSVGRAVFAVDTSMSSNPDKFNIWLALLEATLNNNRSDINEFAVLFFNIETRWWRKSFVKNTPENVAALLARANELALEGATDLGAALGEASSPHWLVQDKSVLHNIFLLSDGAATWGESDATAIAQRLDQASVAGLFAYRTGMSGSDSRLLTHLAREAGGAVFSVVGESEVEPASRAHTVRPWEIRKITVGGAQDILVAGRPQVLFPGQRLVLAGRGEIADGAKITLQLRQGNRTISVAQPINHVLVSTLAPRAYGQLAVGQLEEFLGSTQKFAEAYARHFRVTGKSTSLLMLDSERDYKRYGIAPQDDLGVVQRTAATQLIDEALAELNKVLGDAKHAFLKMATQLPPQVRDVLASLPRSAFEVDIPRLQTGKQAWEFVQPSLQEELRLGRPSYDTVTAMAAAHNKRGHAAQGLKTLSSLVEANPGDSVLARDIGFTAMRWGLDVHAYHLFRRVANARPWEPQTYWAMAMALDSAGKTELALAFFEVAMNGDWDARFGEFKQIVMMDYMRFLQRARGLSTKTAAYASNRLTEMRRLFGVGEADLLVTIMWNTDHTDVDLHVVEPSGEECHYSHPHTKTGGRLTRDVTQGYGPEMFMHARAPSGTYHVRAHYFASDANRASARTKVYATVYKNWGRKNERVSRRVVTLASGKDKHDIITIKMP